MTTRPKTRMRALAAIAAAGLSISAAALPAHPADPPRKKVAILVFEGVEIIDYTGPYEVFGTDKYDVYLVAASKAPVTTNMGMSVTPKYSYDDAPQADVLVIPGGFTPKIRADVKTLDWIRQTTAHDQITMSVCNGAFILAATGLLDGLQATTTATNLEVMASRWPKVKVVGDQRVVDNGKLITTGGLSAGIDGALHVVERLDGLGRAQQVALGLEYDWRPKGGFVRAKLADVLIPDLQKALPGRYGLVSTEGDRTRWEQVQDVASSAGPDGLTDEIGKTLEAEGKWTLVRKHALPAGGGLASDWKFAGFDREPWRGTLTVVRAKDRPDAYKVRLVIARAA